MLKSRLLKLAPVFAFLGYGSWAFAVNYYVESENYLQAGIIQGCYAFIATLAIKFMVTKLHQKLSPHFLATHYTFVISFLLMAAIPSVIHYAFSTQQILYSILPGVIIGSVYVTMILKIDTKSFQEYKNYK